LRSQGDLVLRAGTYLNSKDARFLLRGVYVADSGSLHAVAEPEEPLSAALRPSELHQHTPDYRCEQPHVASGVCLPAHVASDPPAPAFQRVGSLLVGRPGCN